jgi:hypothetical protein
VGELDDILQDLELSLGPLTGEPTALDGGITNRNYRVTLGGADYVVRRPGKDTDLLGINREAERLATDTAASLGRPPDEICTPTSLALSQRSRPPCAAMACSTMSMATGEGQSSAVDGGADLRASLTDCCRTIGRRDCRSP